MSSREKLEKIRRLNEWTATLLKNPHPDLRSWWSELTRTARDIETAVGEAYQEACDEEL